MIKDLILKRKSYKDKQGNEKIDVQFYLVLDNGNYVRIAPYYFDGVKGKEWNTFKELFLLAHAENKD